MAAERPAHYPVSLVVAGRRCLVVGGGPVAARKVGGLVWCGAAVTVVAPALTSDLEALAERSAIAVHRRPYRPGDVAGYRFVVTATGVAAVDAAVAAEAESAGVWVNSADDTDHCTVLLPSVHRDGQVSIAVSTGGASPALATWLRRRVADAVGPDLGILAELLEEGRRRLQAEGRLTSSVDWQALLDGPLPSLVAEGRLDEARSLVDAATS